MLDRPQAGDETAQKYPFWPERVYFEPGALDYPRGKALYELFKEKGLPLKMTTSHNRVTGIPGRTAREGFAAAKRTLVLAVRRSTTFQSCKPSAHYQLPLATGCPGQCRYCYLHTTLGRKPYLRAYVNLEDVFAWAGRHIREREPETTLFEGAAVSDPLFIEPFTGGLSAAISYFAGTARGRFRFVTKFTNVEPLLPLSHRGHTRIRFSINAPEIIERFEFKTPRLSARLNAAQKVIAAGYPAGFIVAPVFLERGWQERYRRLFDLLQEHLPAPPPGLTFEFITHRFTLRARSNIEEIFPDSGLDMDTEKRQFRYGQFGYGKYLYPPELINQAKAFFMDTVGRLYPEAAVEYFI